MESLLIANKEQGPVVWEHFKKGKEKKIWFEEEMLKMLKETWQHPLVDQYEELLAELKRVS
jgi:DNA primase